jgi:Domain of unknown function (DUF1874)
MATIALLNTTILTGLPVEFAEKAAYTISKTTVEEAASLVKTTGFESFVGHQSAADILSTLLGVEVPFSREPFDHGVGRIALCLKLRGRAPEGVILDREQVEQVGYDLFLLQRDK